MNPSYKIFIFLFFSVLIAKSLNPEQLKMLDEVITWVANEQSCDDSYNNEMFESD